MKITNKIISIPPYISTSWENIASLHVSDENLIIALIDNTRISIPKLTMQELEEIFAAHALFLEQLNLPAEAPVQQQLANPFKLLFGTLESISQALQHNPNYSNLAPLPQEIAEKVEQLGKTLPPEELSNFLHPVAGCNCMYCQISRILKGDVSSQETEASSPPPRRPMHIENTEDEVTAEDLHFEQWKVETLNDKMYLVTNKLDPNEHYSVYLGDPIGCTCGKQDCEHIVAVLRH